MTFASARGMISRNKEKNNPEILTPLVDVEDRWRWPEIQALQNGLDLAGNGRTELQMTKGQTQSKRLKVTVSYLGEQDYGIVHPHFQDDIDNLVLCLWVPRIKV